MNVLAIITDVESGRVISRSLHLMEADDGKATKGFDTGDRDGGVAAGSPDRMDTGGVASEISDSPESGLSGKRGDEKSVSPQLTMRMRVPNSTPSTTISMLSHTLWEDVVRQVNRGSSSPDQKERPSAEHFVTTKKKVQLAEKMLRAAFIEYYRGLAMMKSYSSLNMVAFAKILKKYDKISGQRAAAAYLKAVETSYFNTSDKIVKLMDKVEVLFTEHFASYNRRKAMMSLRPRQKRASHNVTFALGKSEFRSFTPMFRLRKALRANHMAVNLTLCFGC